MITVLSLLLSKMLPMYGIALGGFFIGKHLDVQRQTLANLLLYFIAPVVFFFGIVNASDSGWRHLLLIPLFLCIGSVLACIVHFITKRFYSEQERGILGFIAGSGNTGYFGIPLVAILLGPDALIIAIMVTIGLDLFQYTVGYYLMARHTADPREIILKTIKSPLIWSLLAGMAFVAMGMSMPQQIGDVVAYFNGAYIVLGMLIIGLGLSGGVKKRDVDVKFVASAFAAKFILFPVAVVALIMIDQSFLHIFSSMTHKTIFLLSIVPIASDAVAFATVLNTHPQKTAHTVVLSSIFSIIYVPVLALIFFR